MIRRTTDSELVSIAATLRGQWPTLDPEVRMILDEVGKLHLCWLPFTLRGDTHLVRRVGLSDCATAARLIVEECEAAGRTARFVHGLLVSLPYAVEHSWAEIRASGTWVPVDPVLIGALRTFADLDRERWPVSRSPGAVFVGITGKLEPLLFCDHERIIGTFEVSSGPTQ